MTADDFYFTRPGFVSEILSVQDEFCIIGPQPPAHRDLRRHLRARGGDPPAGSFAFGGWSPVISARLIEVCQNFGWQSNVDSWLMGLSVVALRPLQDRPLASACEPFYERGGGYGLGDTPTYNNMELTCQKGPYNKYWFELLRRQARNLVPQHGATAPTSRGRLDAGRPLLEEGAPQPLRRLPVRVYRRLWHDVDWRCLRLSALASRRDDQACSSPVHNGRSPAALESPACTTLADGEGSDFPETVQGLPPVRTHGRIFGIPLRWTPRRASAEAASSSPTRPSCRPRRWRAAGADRRVRRAAVTAPSVVGRCAGYDLFRLGDASTACRNRTGHVDPASRRTSAARPASSPAASVETRSAAHLQQRLDATPVEFAGWLPIFAFSGNCGTHPQFTHAAEPPAGYRFTCSAPRRRPAWTAVAAARLGTRAAMRRARRAPCRGRCSPSSAPGREVSLRLRGCGSCGAMLVLCATC